MSVLLAAAEITQPITNRVTQGSLVLKEAKELHNHEALTVQHTPSKSHQTHFSLCKTRTRRMRKPAGPKVTRPDQGPQSSHPPRTQESPLEDV